MPDNIREIKIIEAYYKNKPMGKFIDIHALRASLGNLADKVSYKFETINEKQDESLFWTLIRKQAVFKKQKVR